MVEYRKVVKLRFNSLDEARNYRPQPGVDFQLIRFDDDTNEGIKQDQLLYRDSRIKIQRETEQVVDAICQFIVESDNPDFHCRKTKADIDLELSQLHVLLDSVNNEKIVDNQIKAQVDHKLIHMATLQENPWLDNDADHLRSRLKNIHNIEMDEEEIATINEQLEWQGLEEKHFINSRKHSLGERKDPITGIKKKIFRFGQLDSQTMNVNTNNAPDMTDAYYDRYHPAHRHNPAAEEKDSDSVI